MDPLSDRGVYAITDCENLTDEQLLDKTDIILKTGVAFLQYRDKRSNDKKSLANELQAICKKYSTPFIINDDIELAKTIGADGVHLGKQDLDINTARRILGGRIIGISCYNDLDRAIEAENSGADYIALGAFFPSETKPDAVTARVELLLKAKSSLTIPIVAIGGITPENGKILIDAKADFLGVVSGLYTADNTEAQTRSYQQLCN